MVPAVTVLVRVLCWLDFWWCWCFRWRGCWWRWFWVWVGGGPDRLGAVVGQCWVAFCVGLLLVRVSYVLVLWWVLGSLVLPMVPPFFSGVSVGVVASRLGVGGGAGVGVVVPGPGVGRGRSGVTGCGRSPLLAACLVGPPLCPSGFWRPCSPPGGGGCWVPVVWVCVCCVCGAGGACVSVCGVRLWGSCRWRLWGCVLCACSGVCAVCWWCVWVPVLAFLGVVWRPYLVWGLCVVPPPPVSAVWFPAPPWLGSVGGVSPCRPLCVPSPFCLFSVSLGAVFLWCRAWAFPAVVGGGGPCRRLGSLPLVFLRGGADACTPRQDVTLLYGPSICTRSVQMDLLRSQVLQPFPTPGSGTLWVAGESLRDRRVSCLPRWTVCPTRSPSLGPNRSTCRGECSWSGPLVTPPGRCHRGLLTNGPGRIPLYCVCSGGADTVTGGAPKPLRLGPSPASPVGPFRPAPHFAVWFAVVGVPSLRGGVVVVVGGGSFRCSWPCCLCACRPLLCLWFAVGVCVCGAVRARVVSVLVCRAWFVVCGVRRWCVGGVVAGVWCGWSLATPGGGSCVLLPATPGWVSLPVVVGGPRHSWLRSPGGGGVWWGCGWCVVWLVPRHSWRRFLCATPRHSWLGFAAGGGVRFPATPGWGLLAAVVRGVWCVVCGVWCAAVVCWWGCGWCVVWLVPHHSWRRFLCATPRHSWLGLAAGGGGRSSPLLADCPGRGSPPLLAGVCWRRWCAVGLWLVCGVVGPSPLLAEVPACYSPPLLAGFCCRWWCVVPRHSWLGSAGGGGVWCVVCGVWCVVCGVWCAAMVCWWGCGWCVVWLVPRHSRRRFLCATPRHSWLGFASGGGGRSSPLLAEGPGRGSPPLLAGFRCRRWCVVCGVWCVVCGVRRWRVWWVCGWCVVWLVPRHSWRRFLCATPRHSWLGFAAGGGLGLPATPGWGPPVVVVCFAGGGVLCCVCLWCVWVCALAVLCCVLRVCGVCVFGGVVWWCRGCVFRVPFSLVLVCVCALCGPSCWCRWRGGGGSCAVWLPCVCVCVLAVCGRWGGVCHTLAGSRRRSSAWFKKQKKRSCRCVAEMRGMRDA